MNGDLTKDLILNTLATFGSSLLTIFSTFVIIALGFLVFKIGYNFLKDESFSIGGYYLRKTPYAGYNRFRSKKWNMEHMP